MNALESNEDPDFQERFWRIQRAAWAIGAIILLIGAAGLIGSGGALSTSKLVPAPGASFVHERVARVEAPTKFLVHPGTATPVVMLNHSYLESVRIVRVHPEPDQVDAGPLGCSWRFSGSPSVIRFDVIPECPGTLRGSVALGENAPVFFTQCVLP